MNDRMIRTYGSKGCENLTRLAVSAALITLTACGGGGGTDETSNSELDLSNLQAVPPSIGAAIDGSFSAETDAVEAAAGETVAVAILANDNVTEGTQLQLLGQPENGVATLLDTGEVEYTANSGFEGTDVVEYALVALDGTISTGSLYIAVCADCDLSEPTLAAALPTTDAAGNPFCANPDSDPDGDGFGWENDQSCSIPPAGTSVTTSVLTANADNVTVAAGSTTAVAALRNDVITDKSSVDFEIDVAPTSGTIEATDTGVVVYTAPDDYAGSDSLMYSLTDADGNISVANIDFNIVCDTCVTMKGLRLSWPANPAAEGVESYQVFFGPDENIHTSTQLSEVSASDFVDSAPNTVFDIENDLNVTANEGGCFRVKAIRGSEVSEPSDPICFPQG